MNVTSEVIAALIAVGTLVSLVLTMWWQIDKRIREVDAYVTKSNKDRIDELIAVSKDLSDYKVLASDRFASNSQMKDLENRLVSSIDRLSDQIQEMPTKLAEEFARIVGPMRR